MVVVRDAAAPGDAAACAAIYAPYVRDTAISFELEPPPEAEMAARIAAARAAHAWLVAEAGGAVVGYAYGGTYRARPAYRWSCEVSVYVARDSRGGGTGRALYAELFTRLADLGYHTAVAGITLPNPVSTAFHTAMGFAPVGTYREIGWKHGTWHDVTLAQRHLTPPSSSPAED